MKLQTKDITEMKQRLLENGSAQLTRVEQAKLLREVELLRWLVLLLYRALIKVAVGRTTGNKALDVIMKRVVLEHQAWFDDLCLEPEDNKPL